jgi:hypothetical protein
MFGFDGVAPEAVFTVFVCAGVFLVGGMLALIGEMVFEGDDDEEL